ncbi:MAG: ribonuclease E/G [Opitutales bacterium]|nr:ribonuclease E/G [Opitutales bacterium]|tara:strand:+ start:569 stop:2323 length:1755 start_codon:yes stop_codon:yes gene_type:complete
MEQTEKNEAKNTPSQEDHKELREPPKEKKPIRISKGELRKNARERAKKRPLRERIVQKLFSRTEEKSYKELIINCEALETRVALLQEGILEDFDVERKEDERMVGAVFKGYVQNLEPGLKAAFVDIGQPKNAFLHYWDMLPAAADSGVEIVRSNESSSKKNRRKPGSIKDIPSMYPVGSEIVVQITKAQIGSKGPRTTTNIALPGRYLVLMPYAGQCGISRKIEDKKERARLKHILNGLTIPDGMGVIIRTAGEGKKGRFFIRDLHLLLKIWDNVVGKINSTTKPACLYQEPSLIGITARDFLTADVDRVLVDDKEAHRELLDIVSRISPRSKSKIQCFDEKIPIFERFNVERQIEQVFMRRVPLPSGGEIVIEETEALVAVDVNTGGHKGSNKDGKDFILQANVEAAVEVARQVRLRNMGGLIIIDFIDMKQKRDRNAVHKRIKDEMAQDKAKHNILPISSLGIMQMTRQRHAESTVSGIYVGCPYCNGRGSVKSPRAVSIEIQRRLLGAITRLQGERDQGSSVIRLKTYLHAVNYKRLTNDDADLVKEMERSYGAELTFSANEAYHVENFKVLDADTGKEIV